MTTLRDLPLELVQEIGRWCDIDTRRAIGLLPERLALDAANRSLLSKALLDNLWMMKFGFIKCIKSTSRFYMVLEREDGKCIRLMHETEETKAWKTLEVHAL
jgi:hypothetical protein